MSMRYRACLLAALMLSTGCSKGFPSAAGSWRAVLQSPGGPLPFGLRITEHDGVLAAVAINGEEEAPLSSVTVDGGRIVLEFSWYDSRIEAALRGDRMVGAWTKIVPSGVSRLGFSAERGEGPRFEPRARLGLRTGEAAALLSVAGVWEAEFTDEDGVQPARGEFEHQGEIIRGTFLTPTGDYRYLAGTYEDGLLRLSTFDGAHAFLFHARATAEGNLEGDFWSRDSYHAAWTARRAAAPTAPILPDAWRQVGLTNEEGTFRFEFPDLDGNPLSLTDPRFAGKAVLVNIFGSWCPNCNDEAPLLAAWHRRYRDRGLEIVGLAYEFSGDLERDRRQVRRFAERHGIDYPLLVAGVSDKSRAAETLPDLTAVLAYPTTVFIGRDGRVRKIHSGFAGPGTGEHHERLVAELERSIEDLLAEPAPDGTRPGQPDILQGS